VVHCAMVATLSLVASCQLLAVASKVYTLLAPVMSQNLRYIHICSRQSTTSINKTLLFGFRPASQLWWYVFAGAAAAAGAIAASKC
jgi:hypothetical protein